MVIEGGLFVRRKLEKKREEMINCLELKSIHKTDSRALHRLSAQIVELLGENAKIQREAKRLHRENHALRAILMAMCKDAIGILNEADLEEM
jgi:DNA anti-recombination protein RmuC